MKLFPQACLRPGSSVREAQTACAMRTVCMDSGVQFRIRILSPHRCEVCEEPEGWTRQFASVKGALDFVENFRDAKIQISNESPMLSARKKHFRGLRSE